MNNEFIFDESEQTGFRLNTLQLYNWGILQNDKIFTLDFDDKSTLLTGRNGSGKTTIVDAIITLLVPKRYRLYNQSSSGNTKDKERDEESYVLGAYGTSSDESSHSGKTKFLRDKNCISIINGIFCNEVTKQNISLMQVRYFSSSELVAYECVTESKLLIEDINSILQKENAKLDRDKKWRQILKNKCGTEFWDSDGFSKYAARFKNLFGLREDSENKALKLFAQIVGMKELGNLNEFIRQKMIEGIDVDGEFENLQGNYEKLIQCENEIAKTKCQLELLKPVVDTGKKIEESEQKKEKLTNDQDTLPAWYSKTAIEILTKEINDKKQEKENLESQNKAIKSRIERLSNDIEVLSNNSGIQIVREKERQIQEKEKEKQDIQNDRNIFERNANELGLQIPHSDEEFANFIKDIESCKKKFQDEENELDELKYSVRKRYDDLNENLDACSEELQSLGTRSSNIPLKNIEIRRQIAEGTGLSETAIPFVGELVQVKEEEKYWNYAIERLLHNLALTILVTEQNYQKVTEYVKSHDLNGRVVYLRTDLQLGDFIPESSKDTVLGKIEIKQGHELSSWLCRYIYEKWNYICSDDFSVIAKNDKVISSTGLVKNGIKHEKDDSIKERTNAINVLGWNNLDKRKSLSSQIEEIREELTEIKAQENAIKDKLENLDIKNDCVKKLLEFKSYSEIDTDSITIEIQKLIEEKNRLAKENNVEDIERQIEEKKNEKYELTTQNENLLTVIGEINNELKNRNTDFEKNISAWNSILQLKESAEIENAIQIFTSFYEIKEILSIDKLNSEQERINRKIKDLLTKETNTCNSLTGYLKDYMRDIRSPKEEYKRKFGDWTIQFADLLEGRAYLTDWNNCYERLVKDELPKYQKKFKEYLHQNLNADIIRFKNFIDYGNQEIKKAIATLNDNLNKIPYGDNPKTFLQLKIADNRDKKIMEFNRMLKNAIPNAAGYESDDEEEKAFRRIKDFIDFVRENERNRKFILDLRNWHSFAATELKYEDETETHYYSDSNSLSGGEKAKLTYTILASAIAYQFGINESTSRSLRFVIVDEVFSKSDSINAQYAMQLFKQLDLQVMIVTPLDKLNIAEEYISSVHQVQKTGDASRVLSLTMERFRERRAELESK